MPADDPWDVPPEPPSTVRAVSCGCYDCRHIRRWLRGPDEWFADIKPTLRHGLSWRQLVIEHGPLRDATADLEPPSDATMRLGQLQGEVLQHAAAWSRLSEELFTRRDMSLDSNKRRRLEDLANVYKLVADEMTRVVGASGDEPPVYPRTESGLTILGPRVYSTTPDIHTDTVLTWQGVHFVPKAVGGPKEHVVEAGDTTVTVRVERSSNAMAGIGRNKNVPAS